MSSRAGGHARHESCRRPRAGQGRNGGALLIREPGARALAGGAPLLSRAIRGSYAPRWRCPFTKKVGVPADVAHLGALDVGARSAPRARCGAARARRGRWSRPSSPAYSIRSGGRSAFLVGERARSCISQKRPCLPAASAASAASSAFRMHVGQGQGAGRRSAARRRTRRAGSRSAGLGLGRSRGHSKSAYSTIVNGCVFGAAHVVDLRVDRRPRGRRSSPSSARADARASLRGSSSSTRKQHPADERGADGGA